MKKELVDLKNKSDRELLQMQVESVQKAEKNIERIKDNVIFYFYLGLIMVAFAVFKTI